LIIELQAGAHVLPQRGVGGQLEQAAGVVGDAQLLRRAQHTVAGYAAQLPEPDVQRFAAGPRRQHRPHPRARHHHAGARIGRTADDLQALAAAHIDLTDAQPLGLWVRLEVLDARHHHAAKRRRGGAALFDL